MNWALCIVLIRRFTKIYLVFQNLNQIKSTSYYRYEVLDTTSRKIFQVCQKIGERIQRSIRRNYLKLSWSISNMMKHNMYILTLARPHVR